MKRARVVLAVAACAAIAFEVACGGRVLDDGAQEGAVKASPQCPPWSRAEGGNCKARVLTRPTLLQNLGPTGARGIAAAVDDRGRALLAWQVMQNGVPKLVVGEESGDGTAVVVREPAANLSGSALEPAVVAGPGHRATVAWQEERGQDVTGIFVSERADDGKWRDPTSASDALSFAPHAHEPSLLVTPEGETILAWDQWVAAESIYGVQIATRAAGASAWTRPTATNDVLSPHAYYSNNPRLAASADGDVLITWYQAKPGDHLMSWFSERAAGATSFSRASGDADVLSPRGADVGGQGGGSPKVVFGPHGEAAVVWLQADGRGAILPYVATRAPGGAWQRPSSLADSLGTPGVGRDLVAAYGAGGTLVIAWTHAEFDGATSLHVLQRLPNGTWRTNVRKPEILSHAKATASTPLLAAGRDGTLVLAWLEVGSGGSTLLLRRGVDDGTSDARSHELGPIETVSTPDRHADSPALAIGGTPERVVLAFTEGKEQRVQVATIE